MFYMFGAAPDMFTAVPGMSGTAPNNSKLLPDMSRKLPGMFTSTCNSLATRWTCPEQFQTCLGNPPACLLHFRTFLPALLTVWINGRHVCEDFRHVPKALKHVRDAFGQVHECVAPP